MRFMMLIHHDEAALAAAPQKELWAEYGAFNEALAKAAGCRRRASGCSRARRRPPCASTTARPTCSTARMPTPRSSSPATSSSTPRASTRPSSGPSAAPRASTARSRSGRPSIPKTRAGSAEWTYGDEDAVAVLPSAWRARATAASSRFSPPARAMWLAPRIALSEAFAAALRMWPVDGVAAFPLGPAWMTSPLQ